MTTLYAAGGSVPSAPAAVTPMATVPAAPTGVTATAAPTQASLAFTAPADTGGSPITGYQASCTPQGGGTAVTATGTASPIVVAGLTNGTTYDCTVAAVNAVGTGAASAPVAVTPQAAPVAAVTAVPTLSQWGLMLLGLAAAGLGRGACAGAERRLRAQGALAAPCPAVRWSLEAARPGRHAVRTHARRTRRSARPPACRAGVIPFPMQCVNHRHCGEGRDPCCSAHAVWIAAACRGTGQALRRNDEIWQLSSGM